MKKMVKKKKKIEWSMEIKEKELLCMCETGDSPVENALYLRAFLGPSIPLHQHEESCERFPLTRILYCQCMDFDNGSDLLFSFKWKDWELKVGGEGESFTESNNYTNSLCSEII